MVETSHSRSKNLLEAISPRGDRGDRGGRCGRGGRSGSGAASGHGVFLHPVV